MCSSATYSHNRCHAWGPQGGGCCHNHHAGGFRRHFLTAAEKKDRLEEYLKELQAEVKAVEERLKELGEGA
ncbi:hypothetical protein MTHERMOG20_25250 [Moorella thermoacetica]|uniref:DUF5320 domain-containing protein n=1 Tax=Neomoorella thermoacetica TaxID=1525 RepID=UPI00003CAE3F|nr:DUF5320 domain-containing protein [Moorella thermoacetica]AKX95054.1 hypothetical protein MOTHE_c22710 [Moorella thermoacetica]AKX97680.1 hypothetical protein MOTHA_c23440 [Moorella thermoacetica]OIQ53909.1 hypothetical protein MOCA_23740 [Moorella thermoacetica]QDA01502.1 hypothetical protein MothHH_02388 [Moorella thermoacetica]TYL06630.1 hypothetical protein MOOCA_26050 [Moorella thermoacetica]